MLKMFEVWFKNLIRNSWPYNAFQTWSDSAINTDYSWVWPITHFFLPRLCSPPPWGFSFLAGGCWAATGPARGFQSLNAKPCSLSRLPPGHDIIYSYGRWIILSKLPLGGSSSPHTRFIMGRPFSPGWSGTSQINKSIIIINKDAGADGLAWSEMTAHSSWAGTQYNSRYS